MENVFLGSNGLTSSEANHVTNVVKELVKNLGAGITTFRISKATIWREGKEHNLNSAEKIDFSKNIMDMGRLYSLSSWLKEGIKSKESLIESVSVKPDLIEEPSLQPMPEAPITTFSAFLNTLTVKEVNEYFSNEATAAHIGKFIHNFDEIRKGLDNFSPTAFERISENEVLTVKQELLYKKEELLDGFFNLQKEHREAEKVVNYYKSKHKDWEKEILDDFSKDKRKISADNQALRSKYDSEKFIAQEKAKTEERALRKEYSNLKIIIPHELQATLDEVNQHAKK